jgi:hypothetical protein
LSKFIKISDCLDEIDNNEISNIKLNKNLRLNISQKRIRKLAMSGIQKDPAELHSEMVLRKKFLKKVILIPSIAVILIISVVAAGNFNTFRTFFSDSLNIIEGKTQTISAQDSQNGVTFKVDEALTDGKKAIITFDFTKNDGTAFKQGTKLMDINIDGNGCGFDSELSSDLKTLSGYINIDAQNGNTNINLNNITISANNLVIAKTGMEYANINLKKLYGSNEPYNVKLLPDLFSDITLDNISFSRSKIGFKVNCAELPYVNNKPNPLYTGYASIFCLKNTITGETLYPQGEGSLFDLNSPDKLENMVPGILYHHITQSVEAEWKVQVKLENAQKIASKNLDISYDDNSQNIKVTISEMNYSLMGMQFKGVVTKPNGNFTKPMCPYDSSNIMGNENYILFKDGSKIYLRDASGEIGLKDGCYDFTYGFNYSKSPSFIIPTDPKQYLEFYLSDKKKPEVYSFIEPKNISEVVIHGISIALKQK